MVWLESTCLKYLLLLLKSFVKALLNPASIYSSIYYNGRCPKMYPNFIRVPIDLESQGKHGEKVIRESRDFFFFSLQNVRESRNIFLSADYYEI